jgi:hypothetical protein
VKDAALGVNLDHARSRISNCVGVCSVFCRQCSLGCADGVRIDRHSAQETPGMTVVACREIDADPVLLKELFGQPSLGRRSLLRARADGSRSIRSRSRFGSKPSQVGVLPHWGWRVDKALGTLTSLITADSGHLGSSTEGDGPAIAG